MQYRPGEKLLVTVDREGLDPGERIGHLPDETMVVIVGGDSKVGERIEVVVAKILETSLGKSVMAYPKF